MQRALFVVTSHSVLGSTGKPTGWYLPEVSHVWAPLVDAGWTVDFASPAGGAAPMDPSSRKLEEPFNRRLLADAEATAKLAATIAAEDVDPTAYDLVFFAGGHGTMWDLRTNRALQAATARIYAQGGVVAAVCHGPAGLVDVKLPDGRWLVDGHDVAVFSDAEEAAVGLTGVVPFLLESALVARGARSVAGRPWSDTVAVSGRLITGQNPQSARSLASRVLEVAATLA
jgi:putative intracellular protease/amidase